MRIDIEKVNMKNGQFVEKTNLEPEELEKELNWNVISMTVHFENGDSRKIRSYKEMIEFKNKFIDVNKSKKVGKKNV